MPQRNFFYLPRSDRRILLGCIVVFIAAVAIRSVFSNDGKTARQESKATTNSMAEQTLRSRSNNINYRYDEGNERVVELFPFDPNTADSTQLLRLGLAPYQVRNIYRYRQKGGTFRHKEDFSRIYGITEKQYREIEPYICISSDYRQATPRYAEETQAASVRDTVMYPIKLKDGQTISLNLSDTAQLKKVPGIGSGYARAIVSYRERLGGFVSVNQLVEIKGLPESALDYFREEHAKVKKIAVNNLNVNQLRKHPYISFYQAKAIVDYRRLKGKINSIDDLKLLKEFTSDDIERLRPYLAY